jgi:hypothetical protein
VHHHHKVLIVHKVQQLVAHQVRQLAQVAVDQIAVPVAVALQVHLEKMPANLQSVSRSLVKRSVMSSTICKRHNLVAQLFHTVMEVPRFVCAAVHLWQILPRRLAPIQQR